MILDKYALFDDATNLAGAVTNTGDYDLAANTPTNGVTAYATGAYPSAKSYDTGAVGVSAAVGPGGAIGGTLLHDIGRGHPMKVMAQITTAVTSGGTGVVQIDFISSTAATMDAAVTVLQQSAAIAKATLVVGYRFAPLYVPGKVPQRYVSCGLNLGGGTADLTAGAITTGLVMDVDDHAAVFGA